MTDLYGENLLLMHRGWSHYVDQLRDDLWQHHPLLKVIPVEWEYGILLAPEPTPTVQRFLDAAKSVREELYE